MTVAEWRIARARFDLSKRFNPQQARDNFGRWSDEGLLHAVGALGTLGAGTAAGFATSHYVSRGLNRLAERYGAKHKIPQFRPRKKQTIAGHTLYEEHPYYRFAGGAASAIGNLAGLGVSLGGLALMTRLGMEAQRRNEAFSASAAGRAAQNRATSAKTMTSKDYDVLAEIARSRGMDPKDFVERMRRRGVNLKSMSETYRQTYGTVKKVRSAALTRLNWQLAKAKASLAKGDKQGHPFYGNQWTSGVASAVGSGAKAVGGQVQRVKAVIASKEFPSRAKDALATTIASVVTSSGAGLLGGSLGGPETEVVRQSLLHLADKMQISVGEAKQHLLTVVRTARDYKKKPPVDKRDGNGSAEEEDNDEKLDQAIERLLQLDVEDLDKVIAWLEQMDIEDKVK